MDEKLLMELAELNGLTLEKCEPGQGGYEMEDGTFSQAPMIEGLFREHFRADSTYSIISSAELIDNMPMAIQAIVDNFSNLSTTLSDTMGYFGDTVTEYVARLSRLSTKMCMLDEHYAFGKVEFVPKEDGTTHLGVAA